MAIGSFFAPAPDENIGASEAVPVTIAFFETTLASAITSSATTFTLTSATDKDGTTLASSTYAFVIDEGSSNEEIVIADCTGTACTNALRGVSALTGGTEVTALKQAHRRGASVKITDAPILMIVSRILRGEAQVDFTPDENYDLVTKTYVDSLALGSTTVSATLTDDGIAELSTGLEAASSTPTGGSGSPLMLHTGISTSTGGTAYTIPVTDSTGKLDIDFIPDYYASTTVFTTTGTSTYTKATGVRFIVVEVQGAGGGGGGVDGGAGDYNLGGSGGGGGYGRENILASSLSATTSVVVGAGGTGGTNTGGNGGTGGESKFGTFCTAPGGAGGNGDDAATYSGGAGGTPTTCHVNITGGIGLYGWETITDNDDFLGGGLGGATYFGGTGAYGSGGTGARGNDGAQVAGSAGYDGVVIITEYF
jgi:hypothetical protein